MRLQSVLTCVVVASSPAFGAGFYLTENGAKAVMMGGAFGGEASDLSALIHNPAGLAQLQGFQFAADGQLVWHNVGFQRYDPGFDPASPAATPAQPVSNSGGPFVLPFLSLGYGLKLLDRNLTIALGLYGPPAYGHYVYPAPNYTMEAGKYVENPKKYAPQRYTLIENNLLIIYPTLSVSFAPHPRLLLGVSLQPVLGSFAFSQSVTSTTKFGIVPATQSQEEPAFDSVAKVNLPWQYLTFTAIAGVLVKPTDWLQLGASFRPQVALNPKGTMEFELGKTATEAGAVVNGKQATLSFMLPAELRVGAHLRPIKKLGINLDFVYQGWQSLQQFTLDPLDVTLQLGGAPAAKVPTFRIDKKWQASYQFRLGASYALFPFLSLYLGGWYETGAIPDEYLGVDFANFSRVQLTGGAGVKLGPIEVLLGAAGSPAQTHAITQSKFLAGSTEPEPANAVGSGVYTTSSFMLSLGIRGNFGPKEEAAAPPVEPTPAPAPAAEPAPAATPTPASEAP